MLLRLIKTILQVIRLLNLKYKTFALLLIELIEESMQKEYVKYNKKEK